MLLLVFQTGVLESFALQRNKMSKSKEGCYGCFKSGQRKLLLDTSNHSDNAWLATSVVASGATLNTL